MTISNKELQINEEIRDKEVRVIDADGSQLGILSGRDAQRIALEKNLDLVKIAPQAKPPVCRIMDYGKYRFEQSKREKEAKKNQRVIEIKEVRLSLNIDTNDFNTKVCLLYTSVPGSLCSADLHHGGGTCPFRYRSAASVLFCRESAFGHGYVGRTPAGGSARDDIPGQGGS